MASEGMGISAFFLWGSPVWQPQPSVPTLPDHTSLCREPGTVMENQARLSTRQAPPQPAGHSAPTLLFRDLVLPQITAGELTSKTNPRSSLRTPSQDLGRGSGALWFPWLKESRRPPVGCGHSCQVLCHSQL